MPDVDVSILLWLNSIVGRWPLIDGFLAIALSDYAIPVALALMGLGLWFSGWEEARRWNQRAVLAAVTAILAANVIVSASNQVYHRTRPFEVHQVKLLFYTPRDSSFPSNSASVVFAMAAAYSSIGRRLGLLAFGLAGLMAFARVYGGVHYPLDIVGGALIGFASAITARLFLSYIGPVVVEVLRIARRFYLA